MSKKLEFNEADILNATWSGMKSLKSKAKKDATDANAISKGLSSITKYMDMKMKWAVYREKNPNFKSTLLLLDKDV